LVASWHVRGANDVNDIGMNLAQGNHAHFTRAERREEFAAVFQNAIARIPVGESQVQDFFTCMLLLRVRTAAIRGELARAAATGAETVREPSDAG